MTQQIMELCRAMGAREDQEELLAPLIEAVSALLAGRLRAGVAPEDCGQAFPLAAAMMAMEELEGTQGGQVTSFTAGEVTIHTQQRTGGDTLTGQAQRLLGPWLGETGFVFRGVRG